MRRQLFVSLVLAATIFSSYSKAGLPGSPIDIDYRSLVSRADLHYEQPIKRSEEGLPVGNGRMGTLVWTMPTSLRLQINRADVFASNSATNSFPERHSDYCGGCGFVDIDFVDFGADVFIDEHKAQHLSCYDGLVTVEGNGVEAQVLAWNEQDVIAIKVSDQRNRPVPISIHLRMLRPAVTVRRSHKATSKFDTRDSVMFLTQKFEEDDYYCGSAVAVGTIGRNNRFKVVNDQELQLVTQPGSGSFTILIASAASFNPKQDIAASALAQLQAAAAKAYQGLVESNKKWWHDFWAKSFIQLHSADGVADAIESNYTYYLYIMASSSRGRFPPKFNGMLWPTGGDTRKWGAQYWGANQSCIYNGLFATNRIELMDPMFDMYTAMHDACATAARQQWGSQGIYIPETVAFDGPAELPEAIAREMQDLYLLRKPWDKRSSEFSEYAFTKQPHSSRWNWKAAGKWQAGQWRYTDKGAGPYGNVNHIFSRGAKIAYKYWVKYEYTKDEQWLRDRAYPMLKGVVEFYRNYPNLRKGPDGRYHIYNVNSNESVLGGQDTDEEISAMRGILPVVIRASEILEVDAAMRPVWREFLDNLAPLPLSTDQPHTWVRAVGPVSRGNAESHPDGNTMPMWYFDLCNLENADKETLKVANATFESCFRSGINSDTRIGVLSKLAVAAAILGRADDVQFLIPNQIQTKETPILANRMTLREGAQTTGLQRIGRAADALHLALCQSAPGRPGGEPVIRLFPAWPRQWDAKFTLLARGAFLVSSSMKNGRIEFVKVHSQLGGECRMRNPWGEAASVTLYRNGKQAENLSGSMLAFPTDKREDIVVVTKND